MQVTECPRAIVFNVLEIIEYFQNSVLTKTIIKKSTGNVSVISFDSGEIIGEKTSPFDTFVQVIDGEAEISLDGKDNKIVTGESIIIPAHCKVKIKANKRFKIISTIIKSGYEEVCS